MSKRGLCGFIRFMGTPAHETELSLRHGRCFWKGVLSGAVNPARFVGKRIAVACADRELRVRTMAELRGSGTSVSARSDLSRLSAEAESYDIVLMFADGFRTQPLRACLEALHGCRSGLVLVVVTDQVPPPWTPKSERDHQSAVFTRSAWEARGLALTQGAQRKAREGYAESEDIRPELPFTD
jgi:hypothetical protein